MSATKWFGDLQLAYKYITVFLSLLVIAFIAGLVKVLFDRRKLKKNVKKEELEAGPKEDTVELNQREKDEGDLFGIRAIEAGFYAGVAQSRPTSRAGSRAGSVLNLPATMSSSTLVGGVNSPFLKGHSGSSSVQSCATLNKSPASEERTSSPALKLRPSEAELTGSHGAVDMSLHLPASPGRSPSSSANSSSNTSPRSSRYSPQHYAPQIAVPSGLQVTYHNGVDNNHASQTASFNSSPARSPTFPPPTTHMPTLPEAAYDSRSRSPSPPRTYRPTTLDNAPTPQPTGTLPTPHNRTTSSTSTSSTYTLDPHHRASTFDAYRAYQAQSRLSQPERHISALTDSSSRGSSILDTTSTHLGLPIQSNVSRESRLSDFYDLYNRQSTIGPVEILDAKRVVARQSTIVEVESPLGSPRLGTGTAM